MAACLDPAGVSQIITAIAAGIAVVVTAITALVLAITASRREQWVDQQIDRQFKERGQ